MVSDSHVHTIAFANETGGIVLTQAGMGSTQALNAAWLSSVVDDRKRPIALAMYVMGIQLAGFPGNQLFRQQGMNISPGPLLAPADDIEL